jgi:2-amino-4-hydroxy-6-hydroxymethyldihydropteridine diphosphokinase
VSRIYLSLGSNLGDRESNLRAALDRLPPHVYVRRASPVYETAPVELTAQPWFLNQVIEAETDLSPTQLLFHTAGIERELGRTRDIPKGPRTLDIDILLYGDEIVDTPELDIPHPRMAERRFVLAPLADLAPGLRHPVSGLTVRQMLDASPPQTVRLLES